MNAEQLLRILIVSNMPWDARLGGARIWMELEAQWRAAGHHVEHFSLSDAFPRERTSRAGFALRQALFSRRAAQHIRANRDRFDVVDALIGSLHQSKQSLRFEGLLVARSIGLHQLYEQFERSIREQRADSRGSIAGRVLYSVLRRRTLRASDQSLAHADLINVPNATEALYLRDESHITTPVIVQPYGLTDEMRTALLAHGAPPAQRLTDDLVCFVGMWSARKGSRDWAEIIARIHAAVPRARFRFLGTMVDDETIARDLPTIDRTAYENISTYEPHDLPRLLSDCAVGAFPSYVEGFGLAVLEQLGAGVPTVAYDVAGPRDMLHTLPQLLVRAGDRAAFAAAVVNVLHASSETYEQLARRSIAAAEQFDWATIATSTTQEYRGALRQLGVDVLFVQPFSLSSAGGGARILRALVDDAPANWLSACTSPQRPGNFEREIHLPTRPSWGKIEHSRLAMFPQSTTRLFQSRFRDRLRTLCRSRRVRSIHAVAHYGLDFAAANEVARELQLPFFLSVHDDVAYTAQHLRSDVREGAIGRAWNEADARFVISDALGREYARRYGDQKFVVVTDGVTEIASEPAPRSEGELRVYFMGLFHMAYERNLRALLDGLSAFARNTGRNVKMNCRCEHIRPQVLNGSTAVTILPFADETQVRRDIEGADVLYMPIPFGDTHANFARYSLSTKMVTYLGSGVPILYHGPADSAAFELLTQHDAAFVASSLDVNTIVDTLATMTSARAGAVVRNALQLAREQFMLRDQREKFWAPIAARIAQT